MRVKNIFDIQQFPIGENHKYYRNQVKHPMKGLKNNNTATRIKKLNIKKKLSEQRDERIYV